MVEQPSGIYFIPLTIFRIKGTCTYLKDCGVGEGVTEYEGSDPRTRPRELSKLLRQEATESRAKDVDFLQGELGEELLESATPFVNAPIGRGVDSDHADAARRQSQALEVLTRMIEKCGTMVCQRTMFDILVRGSEAS